MNFNGSTSDAALLGFNDWANVDLRQVSARRNMLTFSGAMSGTDLASGGGTELISGGGTDLASGGGTICLRRRQRPASGSGTDLASGGGTDLASGGGTDLASGGGAEVDYKLANSTVDPPANVTARQVGHNVVVSWNPPELGQIRTYYVWQANTTKAGISTTNPPVNVGKITVVHAAGQRCLSVHVHRYVSQEQEQLYVFRDFRNWRSAAEQPFQLLDRLRGVLRSAGAVLSARGRPSPTGTPWLRATRTRMLT